MHPDYAAELGALAPWAEQVRRGGVSLSPQWHACALDGRRVAAALEYLIGDRPVRLTVRGLELAQARAVAGHVLELTRRVGSRNSPLLEVREAEQRPVDAGAAGGEYTFDAFLVRRPHPNAAAPGR